MNSELKLIRILLSLATVTACNSPKAIPHVAEEEHHRIDITVCEELSGAVNRTCDDPTDTPITIAVSANDIYPDTPPIATGIIEGTGTFEFDTLPKQLVELGIPSPIPGLYGKYACPTVSTTEDDEGVIKAVIAYSSCPIPESLDTVDI